MKLFDLKPEEKHSVKKFMAWHAGYVIYVGLFGFSLFYFNLFKAYWFFREVWLLNLVAPTHTILFILISPYRRDWALALKNLYRSLDGDPIFLGMGLMVFGLGFYLYTCLIWAAGSLVPSLFFS